MFKNIEMLDKEKFKSVKFASVEAIEVAKNSGMIPLGFNEVVDMACYTPVIIFGEDTKEFVSFTGISKDISIYNNNENTYLPKFTKTYPFVNTFAKDENDAIQSIIGIDNGEYVNKKKKLFIFNKKGEVQKIANEKIEMVRELNSKRDISKKIIKELEEHGLLQKQNFKIQHNDEEKTIIEEFYIVNRAKLIELDDKIISTWAKKGWITIIDCHLKSIGNFKEIFANKK